MYRSWPIALVILLSAAAVLGQNASAPKGITRLIPAGWHIKTIIKLDLNSDGVPDYVALLEWPELQKNEDSEGQSYFPHKVMIFFGHAKSGYRLMLETSTIFGKYNCGVQGNDPFTGLFKRKNLFDLRFVTGGTGARQCWDFYFGYIHKDFCLLESGFSDYELPIDGNGHYNNIYFLKAIEEEYDVINGKRKNYKRKLLKKEPLTKLTNFIGTPCQ